MNASDATAPSPAHSAATGEHARAPESTGAVVGIGLGLVVVTIAALATILPRPAPPDGQGWLGERFELAGAHPFGFEVARSLRMIDGEVLVLLADPGGPPPEAPADPRPAGGGHGGFGGGEGGPRGGARVRMGGGGDGPHGGGGPGGGPGGAWVDWSALPEGEAGTPPVEIAFARYPERSSRAVLKRLFGSVRFRGLKQVGGFGGDVPVDSGHLLWGGYEAAYVRTRHLEKVGGEPTFHETVRVNLTLDEQALVVTLRWLRGFPASVERAEELLAVYRPLG